MKSLFTVCLGFAIVLSPFALAVADCDRFNSQCSTDCSGLKAQNQTINCNPFSSSCSCQELPSRPQDQSGTAQWLDNGRKFCQSQNSTCSSVVCSGNAVDSFSCDPYSFSAQCQCKSNSNMKGGQMLGKDEQECQKLQKKCTNEICSGKKVITNVCSVPKDAQCQCEGGPIVNPNTGSTQSQNNGPKTSSDIAFILTTIFALTYYIY